GHLLQAVETRDDLANVLWDEIVQRRRRALIADRNDARLKTAHLLRQPLNVLARRQRDDFKPVGKVRHHVAGADPDRAGRTENGEPLHLHRTYMTYVTYRNFESIQPIPQRRLLLDRLSGQRRHSSKHDVAFLHHDLADWRIGTERRANITGQRQL